MSSLRPAAPDGSGIAAGHLDRQWAEQSVSQAAIELLQAFTHDGSEGLLRLRLRPDDVRAIFTDEAQQRIARLPTGLIPAPGENRWQLFRTFADAPVLGFCARGARIVEPNGPEGLRTRGLVVDRLLIVGGESDGYWGAWVEGLLLTNEGWRLLPTVPYDRQVETPRRDHSDVQLWECDLARRPDRAHPLEREPASAPPGA
jgi:hypothetical protein